jgi:hypothetical protein
VNVVGKPGHEERRQWLLWVLANAVGEAVGLGITALVGAVVIFSLGEGSGVLATLGMAALAILAGTFVEGTVVGTAQWLVLRRSLSRMRWRTWALATGAGAFLAWTLGMIPSTVLSLGAGPSDGGEPQAEPSQALMYGLAFLMGLVLGPVLGFAQWLALRRYVRGAALWMPANALAWALGMVVIFVGIDPAFDGGFGVRSVAILAFTLALAGAVVGAVHGLALVRLLHSVRLKRGDG